MKRTISILLISILTASSILLAGCFDEGPFEHRREDEASIWYSPENDSADGQEYIGVDEEHLEPTVREEPEPSELGNVNWPSGAVTSAQTEYFWEVLTTGTWNPRPGVSAPFGISFDREGTLTLYEPTESSQSSYELLSLLSAPNAFSALLDLEGQVGLLVITEIEGIYYLSLNTPFGTLETYRVP